MKIILIITISLFNYYVLATPGPNCEQIAQSADDQIAELVKCLEDPDNYEPSKDLKWRCENCKVTGMGDYCYDDILNEELETKYPNKDMLHEAKIDHCTGNKNTLCFDGKALALTSENKSMMEYLCTDSELTFSNKKFIVFGDCKLESNLEASDKGLRSTDKLSCYCQGKSLPKWHCYNTNK